MTTSRSGFTLLEVMAGTVLVTIGFVGLTALQVRNERSYEESAETSLVSSGFRSMAERIRATPFDQIVNTYQGAGFAIESVDAQGTITIFVDETEDTADSNLLGLPRDLDGDGAATNPNVSATAILLPVRLRLSWVEGGVVSRARDFHFFLAPEE